MTAFRVEVDGASCIGSGMCRSIAPEVFDFDEEAGLVRLLDSRPPAHTAPAVREAVLRCPAAAILTHEKPAPVRLSPTAAH
ncbi:ferredoxin [Catenuloplanes nepalensis]|uniref:Ferredoxin n=1 Tax=Catenuloplanes nepalensis TaxID=587533 RepID=A0ABT9MW99_9ACTN|nr:ferredoxin [Catenuloplanes nepalensis]MDP9795498.1 ferredoxin [Catenuloplanes nepalensis]